MTARKDEEEPRFSQQDLDDVAQKAASGAITEVLTATQETTDTLRAEIKLLHEQVKEFSREPRVTRDQEARAAQEVYEEYEDLWEERGMLDTSLMPARPGFVQRWVRTMLDQHPDHRNVAKKFNQGWRPRFTSSIPEGIETPSTDFGKWTGVVGIEGMILMERPAEMHAAQVRRIKRDTQRQMTAVDATMARARNPGEAFGTPTAKRRRQVTRGGDPTFGRAQRTALVAPD